MTSLVIGDKITPVSIKDGVATCVKEQAEITREDGGDQPLRFGGDANSKITIRKPVREIMTRAEKRELGKAIQLYNEGRFGMMLQKYGTENIATIRRRINKQIRTQPRYIGLRFTAEGMRTTAPRAREELHNES